MSPVIEVSVTGIIIFPYKHFSPGDKDETKHHFGFVSWILSRSSGLKFPIWIDNTIHPRNRSTTLARFTGLIWKPSESIFRKIKFPKHVCYRSPRWLIFETNKRKQLRKNPFRRKRWQCVPSVSVFQTERKQRDKTVKLNYVQRGSIAGILYYLDCYNW